VSRTPDKHRNREELTDIEVKSVCSAIGGLHGSGRCHNNLTNPQSAVILRSVAAGKGARVSVLAGNKVGV